MFNLQRIPTREQNAQVVLDALLSGQKLTQKATAKLSNMEDSGRIFDFIRRKFLVPVECERKAKPTVWFIDDTEIYRYVNDRPRQIEEQQAKLLDNRINKIIAWAIEIASTEQGKILIQEAMLKVGDEINIEKRQADKPSV